ncbi:MAG: hypothetical protein P1S60_04395 [Anaerolineae bacterium]|nr:hypothetical protein [Anaerolineae bacterium]
MTFSCPNYDHASCFCQRLNKLCVAGRPGCVLEGKVDFGEDIEVRIARAEARHKLGAQSASASKKTNGKLLSRQRK